MLLPVQIENRTQRIDNIHNVNIAHPTPMPTFSVIIPVYNAAPFLRECIGSLITSAKAAGSVPIELVCVDDGSSDGSSDILDELSSEATTRAPNVSMRVVHKSNEGASSARNVALNEAKGDWIMFVDADDLVRATYISDIAEAIAIDPNTDLVGFGMITCLGNEVNWPDNENGFKNISTADTVPDEFAYMGFSCFAYRRDILKNLRFKQYAFGEDLVFAAEAFVRSRNCMITSRNEYAYRQHQDSVTHSGVSIDRLPDTVTFHIEMFHILESSSKRVGQAFAEIRGNMWIEELPKIILPLIKTPDGHKIWELWLNSMSVAANLSVLSKSQRRRAQKVATFRSMWAVLWYCRLPAWLRRKVFRR